MPRGPASPRPSTRPAARPTVRVERPLPERRPSWVSRLLPGQASQRMVRALALAGVAVVLGVLLFPSVHAWLRQRDRIEALQVQVEQQKAEVADLEKQLKRWQDPAYVEQQARIRLKFVKVGEKAYTVIDANPEVPVQTGPATSLTPTSPDTPWYSGMWSSIRAADSGAQQLP